MILSGLKVNQGARDTEIKRESHSPSLSLNNWLTEQPITPGLNSPSRSWLVDAAQMTDWCVPPLTLLFIPSLLRSGGGGAAASCWCCRDDDILPLPHTHTHWEERQQTRRSRDAMASGWRTDSSDRLRLRKTWWVLSFPWWEDRQTTARTDGWVDDWWVEECVRMTAAAVVVCSVFLRGSERGKRGGRRRWGWTDCRWMKVENWMNELMQEQTDQL